MTEACSFGGQTPCVIGACSSDCHWPCPLSPTSLQLRVPWTPCATRACFSDCHQPCYLLPPSLSWPMQQDGIPPKLTGSSSLNAASARCDQPDACLGLCVSGAAVVPCVHSGCIHHHATAPPFLTCESWPPCQPPSSSADDSRGDASDMLFCAAIITAMQLQQQQRGR